MCNYFQKLAVILCLSIICISTITAQSNSLRVQDPQQAWRSGTARIETASFDVRPRGLYAEVSLNMTYSAQGTSYSAATDTLEIQHYFTLPANALVTDSWLWVENQIVYAKLIDRWTASAIYEGIVKRRQDPSILFKNQATGYEYRIFPMAGNKTRRVQLHFMMPIEWQSGSATFELPTNLLRWSNRTPNTTVRIFNNAQWKNPRLTDFPTQTLTAASDSTTNQPILTTTLTATQVNSSTNPRISYNSPMKNGVFVSTFKQGGENFYQMAIQPDQFLNVNTAPRKLLYLVDYNTNQAALTAADLVATIKQNIRSTITARDSFNFIFSRLLPTPLSNKWISAANLETTLAQITDANVSAFSNLPNVLAKGIEFTKNNTGGEIALISNDASISSLNAANALLADLKSTFPVLPVIHVLDYSTTSTYFWLNNTYYYGNDYFYNIITSQTGGNFTNVPLYNYSDIKVFFTQFFRNSTAYFENFQTYTTLTSGYCHSRFDIGSTGIAYINKPILQVGKFAGQTPFQVEVTGSYQGTPFGKRVSIPDSLVTNGDSTMRQIWAGAQILTWEAQTPRDNATTKRVIEMSQNNLVLSLFTAFLALEPGMGGDTCRACRNPTVTATATKDIANDSFRMVASPNPFSKATTLKVTFPAFKVGQKADLSIYTLMGKAVKRFDLDIKTGDTSAEVNWEASDVPAGMYIVRFTSGAVVKTLKIVKTE